MVVFSSISKKNVHVFLLWNISFTKNSHPQAIYIEPASTHLQSATEGLILTFFLYYENQEFKFVQ